MDLSYNGLILYDACRCASEFIYFKAQYISRNCNVVVDRIAMLARNRDKQVWISKALSCIRDILANEACC